MNYECLTKLLKAIYYASQKVIRLKLVKYKLKLKKQKNNLYEKEQLITVAPFTSYNTSDFYSTLVSKTTSAKVLSSPIFKITSH